MSERLVLGLGTTFICMSIVFIVLVGLSYVISIQRAIIEKIEESRNVKRASKVQKAVEVPKPVVQKMEEDSEELIAVISAAAAVALGRLVSNIIVRSIRRLEPRTPSWNAAGLQEQMGSRL